MYTPITETEKKIQAIKIRDAVRALVYASGFVKEGEEADAEKGIEHLATAFEADLHPLQSEIESLTSANSALQKEITDLQLMYDNAEQANDFLRSAANAQAATIARQEKEIERMKLCLQLSEQWGEYVYLMVLSQNEKKMDEAVTRGKEVLAKINSLNDQLPKLNSNSNG